MYKSLWLCLMLTSNIVHAMESDEARYFAAAEEGNLEAVLAHLEQEGINAVNEDGSTALVIAAFAGHAPVVKALLERGASPFVVNAGGQHALMGAASHNLVDIAQDLMYAGLSATDADADGDTVFIYAASAGSIEFVRFLLEWDVPCDVPNKKGMSPLMWAALAGHEPILRTLIKAGAYIDRTTIQNMPAILLAAQEGHHEILQVLAFAQAKLQTLQIFYPLLHEGLEDASQIFKYVRQGDYSAVIRLIKQGVRLDGRDPRGRTVMHYALKNLDKKMMVILLGNNPELLTLRDYAGELPMTLFLCDEEILEYLFRLAFGKPTMSGDGAACLFMSHHPLLTFIMSEDAASCTPQELRAQDPE